MKKPDFAGVATQTWAQLRRFPSGDGLADAVLVSAIYGLLMAPFAFKKYFLRETWEWEWTWLFLPLNVISKPLGLLRHFDLSLRLRRDEKKAWRTATIQSSIALLLLALNLLILFWTRNEPREATEFEQRDWTDEQRAAYRENWARLQAKFERCPWSSPWNLKQIFWHLLPMALVLNVLFYALQPATRARFRTLWKSTTSTSSPPI